MTHTQTPVATNLLGEMIRAARKLSGFSNRVDFAAKLDVDPSTVKRWENGRNLPRVENLVEIAQLTGRPVNDFMAALRAQRKAK